MKWNIDRADSSLDHGRSTSPRVCFALRIRYLSVEYLEFINSIFKLFFQIIEFKNNVLLSQIIICKKYYLKLAREARPRKSSTILKNIICKSYFELQSSKTVVICKLQIIFRIWNIICNLQIIFQIHNIICNLQIVMNSVLSYLEVKIFRRAGRILRGG